MKHVVLSKIIVVTAFLSTFYTWLLNLELDFLFPVQCIIHWMCFKILFSKCIYIYTQRILSLVFDPLFTCNKVFVIMLLMLSWLQQHSSVLVSIVFNIIAKRSWQICRVVFWHMWIATNLQIELQKVWGFGVSGRRSCVLGGVCFVFPSKSGKISMLLSVSYTQVMLYVSSGLSIYF